jgi:hypothetical protein
MKSGLSTDFSMVRRTNRVLTPLKSASFEIRISSFVPPSKIFVWMDKVKEFRTRPLTDESPVATQNCAM